MTRTARFHDMQRRKERYFVPDRVESVHSVTAAASPVVSDTDPVPCPFGQFLLYFLRLGTFGFGGPIALAGRMQRDLVEQRRWVSKQDYVEGLAFAQLC